MADLNYTNDGYDPEYLELEKSLGGRPSIPQGQEAYCAWLHAEKAKWPASDLPEGIETRDEKIDEHITVRIYTPREASNGPLPVGVYFHGGGYVSGDLDCEDTLCRYIAGKTPCVLVSVDYRFFPAVYVPQEIEDCLTAYQWAWDNHETLSGDKNRYFATGGSAGAGLALSVTKKLVESGRSEMVKGCAALNPISAHMDNPPERFKHMYTSYTENGTGAPLLSLPAMQGLYGILSADPNDDSIFTSLTNKPELFPPTYISVCEKDVLRDDGKVMAAVLEEAGVKVKVDEWKGLGHYFFVYAAMKKRLDFLDKAVDGIRWMFESAS